MPTCRTCKQEKPNESFSVNRKVKGGLCTQCKACDKEKREANAEAIRLRKAKYRAENKQKIKETNARRYQENKEAHDAKCAEWRAKNPDYSRQYEQKNKEDLAKKRKEYRQQPEIRKRDSENGKLYRRRPEVRMRDKLRDAQRYQEKRGDYLTYAKEYAERVKGTEAYKARCNARGGRQRAGRKQATPKWANHEAIKAIYAEAAWCSEVSGEPHHVDHIVPLTHPLVCGLHCEANLRVLLGAENMSKGNRFWPDMP